MSARARNAKTRQSPLAPTGPSGDVRVGPLRPITSLLAGHGLDPSLVLAQVGFDPRLLDNPENRVSFHALGHLLETCVKLTSCPHFGLLVGQRFNLDALGVLGQLMRNCPTVRDALRMGTLHLDLHDRGAVALMLDLGRSQVALGYTLFAGNTPATDQILDGAIAMHFRLLRDLGGPAWRPLRVHFSHSRPAEIAPFRKYFGPRLAFDARLSAVVFDSRWLDHRIEGANPAACSTLIQKMVSNESRQATSFVGQVRRAIYAMMFTATASSASLAELFGLHERTLRRRLEVEGATVRELVGGVRREIAHHLLRHTNLPVSEIASVLGYSDVTVFARAFRSWSDISPRDWRAQLIAARSASTRRARPRSSGGG